MENRQWSAPIGGSIFSLIGKTSTTDELDAVGLICHFFPERFGKP